MFHSKKKKKQTKKYIRFSLEGINTFFFLVSITIDVDIDNEDYLSILIDLYNFEIHVDIMIVVYFDDDFDIVDYNIDDYSDSYFDENIDKNSMMNLMVMTRI